MDSEGERTGTAPAPPARADTAVSPVIRGEPVDIPTPVWGALVQEDLRRIEAGELEAPQPGAEGYVLPRPRRMLGWIALGVAVLTALVHAWAVAAAGYTDVGLGTLLAWVAIVCSGVAVVLGVMAAITGRGRWLGVIGAVVGLLANPWVVLQVLRLFAG